MAANISLNNIKDIGGIVRYHRQQANLSRLSLAEISGVGKTAVYDIENGKESVKINTLVKVLKTLNISLELKSPIMENYDGKKNEKS